MVASIEALTMAKSLEAVIRQLDACERPIVLGIDNQAASAIAQPSSTASWRNETLACESLVHSRASYLQAGGFEVRSWKAAMGRSAHEELPEAEAVRASRAMGIY